MEFKGQDDCSELLVDIIAYEIRCGRFSPEMEVFLAQHLSQCPSCRRKFQDFTQVIAGELAFSTSIH
jgi:hypothetical protein